MARLNRKLRVAMPAWEIGRTQSELGTKVGGLGVIIEELPPEMVKAAASQGIKLEVEVLSPCFAHYDRSRMKRLDISAPAIVEGHSFEFEVYEHIFPDGQRAIYFWDEGQLGWTGERAIYPEDTWMAAKLYSAMSQAMAAYIRQQNFDTIHLHDYHVGLVPFFLGDQYLREVPIHFTIHNASYQGTVPLRGGGYETLELLNLSGERFFHKYFDFFDYVNMMKACMLVVHENGGKITTVSGDLEGSWGYAAELRESERSIRLRALAQKGRPPLQVFVPNSHLDLFEKLPVIGITNGMSDINRPENLPELIAGHLRQIQERNPHKPLFRNPTVQSEMFARDHNFDADHLEIKAGLKRLLHLEAFGYEGPGHEASADPIIFTVVGRLVDQKNPLAVCDIIERVLAYDSLSRFVIIAAAPDGDPEGKAAEARLASLARQNAGRVHLDNSFNIPMARLALAGGDFALIPSKFEPCGLVDYEASLVGNIVIGRLTGGLAKVRHYAYLYDWLDTGDRAGESHAFFQKIREAIDVYRYNAPAHMELMRRAMAINSSWAASASQYVEMYRYGLLAKKWLAGRHQLIEKFARSLKKDRELFGRFFRPGGQEYSDRFNWDLKDFL